LEDAGFEDNFEGAVVPATETGDAEKEEGMMVMLIVNDWVEGSSGNVLMAMEQWRCQQ